ncbi:MAG TPA: hypothetical protein VHB97_07475 [Polyangia bacterium]|nr:hypothetical protein [Polyangia bacterium]
MRALVVILVAVAGGCDCDDAAPSAPSTTVMGPAAAQKARDGCRDACEQQVVVAQAGDAALRACRDGCDARFAAAAPPREVPSRITRAAPAHAPPAVRPR